jgi:hypothetical protein
LFPDFPALKKELTKRLARGAQALAEGEPLLRNVKSFVQHEGDRTLLIREDRSESLIRFDTPITTEVSYTADDIRQGGDASVRAMRHMGEQLGEGMGKRMFDALHKAVDEVGNAVDAKGQPFGVDILIEALEKMDFSFSKNGEWRPPTIVVHPDTYKSSQVQIEAANADPLVKARIDALVEEKREEWRAREARRTLAD